jgi:hypothetical protein
MFTSVTMKGMPALAACALLAGAATARAEGPVSLDEAMRRNAPRVLAHLQGKNDKKQAYKNVGVLKFLVQGSSGALIDNAGPLNRSLADRLEVALILANEDRDLGILSHASESVAASGMRVSHRIAEQRERFFGIPARAFLRAWGKLSEGPDCFLTGEARFATDLRTITVTIQAFGKDDPQKLRTVCTFEAATDARTLGEAGLRYLSPRPRGLPIPVIKQLAEDKEQNTNSVLPASTSDQAAAERLAMRLRQDRKDDPVELQVYYGKTLVERNAAGVPSPEEGSKVWFKLINHDKEAAYGVVLLVNGENTIFREEQGPPLEMYKWILEPGKSITIEGYQINQEKSEAFKVLTPKESEEMAVHYGKDAGLINLWVFRGIGKDETNYARYEAPKPAEETRLVAKGMPKLRPNDCPNDLLTLQNQLRKQLQAEDKNEANGPRARGLIVSGEQVKSAVATTPFRAYPVPVKFDTIRYYQPGP